MSGRRERVLHAMGLGPLWRLRGAERADDTDAVPAPDTAAAPVESVTSALPEPAPTPARAPRAAVPVAPAPVVEAPAAPRPAAGVGDDVATLDWPALTERILACRACTLCEQRTQAVPGVGDRSADWLFVGEGPGAEEDARGEPFVGKAGKLLDAMLGAIGLKRGDGVYIANTVKCRPPLNRTPETTELAACFPYLARQITLIRPRIIVALGRPAAQSLLNTDIRIAAARGKRFDYDGIPVVVTYHPAYLLRNPMDKAKAWEDLCFARRQMAPSARGEDS